MTLSTLTRMTKGGIVAGMFGAMLWTGIGMMQGESGCSGSNICTGSCTPSDGGNGCCAADPSNNNKCTCYAVNSGCS